MPRSRVHIGSLMFLVALAATLFASFRASPLLGTTLSVLFVAASIRTYFAVARRARERLPTRPSTYFTAFLDSFGVMVITAFFGTGAFCVVAIPGVALAYRFGSTGGIFVGLGLGLLAGGCITGWMACILWPIRD